MPERELCHTENISAVAYNLRSPCMENNCVRSMENFSKPLDASIYMTIMISVANQPNRKDMAMKFTINGKTYTTHNIIGAIYDEFYACARGWNNSSLTLARELAVIAVENFNFTPNDIDAIERAAYGIR